MQGATRLSVGGFCFFSFLLSHCVCRGAGEKERTIHLVGLSVAGLGTLLTFESHTNTPLGERCVLLPGPCSAVQVVEVRLAMVFSVWGFVCLSACLPVCLPVCPFVQQSVGLAVGRMVVLPVRFLCCSVRDCIHVCLLALAHRAEVATQQKWLVVTNRALPATPKLYGRRRCCCCYDDDGGGSVTRRRRRRCCRRDRGRGAKATRAPGRMNIPKVHARLAGEGGHEEGRRAGKTGG